MRTIALGVGVFLKVLLNGHIVSKATAQGADATGWIEGTVTFKGNIPKASTADDAGVRRELLQVDKTNRGLANVVVWLTGQDSRLKERSSPKPPMPASMDQRDHEFAPRVIAVLSGQAVKFTNSDAANHNVRTTSAQRTNEFNVFTGVDGHYTHWFVMEAEQRPVRVGCDIHPWMRGWIYVFDHSFFAVTDDRGRFRISSVPAGEYKLALRQPDIGYARHESITVTNNQPAKIQIEIRSDEAKKKD